MNKLKEFTIIKLIKKMVHTDTKIKSTSVMGVFGSYKCLICGK